MSYCLSEGGLSASVGACHNIYAVFLVEFDIVGDNIYFFALLFLYGKLEIVKSG